MTAPVRPKLPGLRRAVDAALANVAAFGDTDIFHKPFELERLRLDPKGLQAFGREVMAMHGLTDLGGAAAVQQPCLRSLVPVGTNGFRLGTLIDPVWNLYFLALTLRAAPVVERARSPVDAQVVFSYRHIEPDAQGHIFNPAIGWRQFIDRTQARCSEFHFVVQTDVAEFYHRINSRRVAFALAAAGVAPSETARLAELLGALGADDYGLPVGGPASRILAEAVLAPVDAELMRRGVRHCRFVDDFRLFASSQAQAQHSLYALAEALWQAGLSLQKGKTRILRAREQLEEIHLARMALQMPVGGGPHAPLDAGVAVDPYSELRAQGDGAVSALALHADAVSILRREFSKTRANPSLGRRVLAALRHMPTATLQHAVQALLEPRQRAALEPVFLRFLAVMGEVRARLGSAGRSQLSQALAHWLTQRQPIVQAPAHEAATLALLRQLPGRPGVTFRQHLRQRYAACQEVLVRREIALYWGAKRCRADLHAAHGEVGSTANHISPWERRAVEAAQASLRRHSRAARDLFVRSSMKTA